MEANHSLRIDSLSNEQFRRLMLLIETAGFSVHDFLTPGTNPESSFVAIRNPSAGRREDPITWAASISVSLDKQRLTLSARFPGWWQQPLLGSVAGFLGLCIYQYLAGDSINWQGFAVGAIVVFLFVTGGRRWVWRDYKARAMDRLRSVIETAQQVG